MFRSAVKCPGLTRSLRSKPDVLSARRGVGIHGVAVKCLDIMKNSDREGICPECN